MRALGSFVLLALVGACGDDDDAPPLIVSVHAGSDIACGLDGKHHVWCWGTNANLAITGSTATFEPLAVAADAGTWDSLALTGGHVCGLSGAQLACWGDNTRDQVSGEVTGDVATPRPVTVPGVTVAAWTAVSASLDSTCAIGDGTLYCWGAGSRGKLGTGLVDDEPAPVPVVTDLRDWKLVATGARHTCAVSASAGLFCWGDGSSGQLGNGLSVVRSLPQPVAIAGEVVSLAIGLDSTCAVTADGALWCWGRAAAGALGDPQLVDPAGIDRTTPVAASSLTGWSEVAAAEAYACARRDGEVWCWGTAHGGGTGDGRWDGAPAFAKVLDGATSLAVGWNGTSIDPLLDEADVDLTCATTADGVLCWGDNRSGQLGQGTTTRSATPVAIAGDRLWQKVVAGADHACGLAGGEVACWGANLRGQVRGAISVPDDGAPVPITDGATQLAAGAAHTCALRGDAITCWGANDAQQCGAAAAAAIAPTDVAGSYLGLLGLGANSGCGHIAAGAACWGAVGPTMALHREPALDAATSVIVNRTFGCQLDAAGALACFGDAAGFGNGGPGTCGDGACNNGETVASCAADCGPTPLTHLGRTYTAIATGLTPYTCGVRVDGAVECWGDNTFGQTADAVLTSVVPFVLPGLSGCTHVATGALHACAVCSGGLACWGDARHGELGLPIAPVASPRVIAPVDGDPWIDVAAGDAFTCAVAASGRGSCWGTAAHGALGSGGTSANLPVKVKFR